MFLVNDGALRTNAFYPADRRAEHHPDRDADAQPDRDVSGHHSGDRSQRGAERYA
jgi:hypothetical protein